MAKACSIALAHWNELLLVAVQNEKVSFQDEAKLKKKLFFRPSKACDAPVLERAGLLLLRQQPHVQPLT
jgi:hypothetical protein